ncbi:histidine kinase [Oscillospiraceae bacterium HV4-5-C5C]|nr:histidine kinase [Oscillospiraceae bacterium HV4-5-C5C]
MRRKAVRRPAIRNIWTYLKDYRFSSILLKYFLLLFLCLVLPITVVEMWFSRQQKEQVYEEIIKRNEASLAQGYSSVYSILKSSKNLSYSLSANEDIRYLAVQSAHTPDSVSRRDSLTDMLAVSCSANSYIDSIYIYFANTDMVVTNLGSTPFESFEEKDIFSLFSSDMPKRNILLSRIKRGWYPYLLTVLYPVDDGRGGEVGLVAVNLDVEKIGDYIGRGKYRNTDYSPRLFIFDRDMQTLVYSDEYRLLQEPEEAFELRGLDPWEGSTSEVLTLWGERYVVSAFESEEDGLRYFYVSTMSEFEALSRETNLRMLQISALTVVICLVIAFLLSVWVYRPVKQTLRVLSEVSMLTDWDKKEHVDEIEAIQRSILSAKKENDDLNAQIQERIVSLHNAQICALQAQINPHFLFNTLESIANVAALLLDGDNKVTEMICTLGKLIRISLSNENYLVPLHEELEHVNLYVKLVDFRFHGRVTLHQEIPPEMGGERIVKLTLQPLIENAIQHGLTHKRSGGEIWLRGERRGSDNYLYVTDNGEGLAPEKLEELTERLRESSVSGGSHIGLRNVNQRLKLIFGEEYGLSLSRAEEGGLHVAVRFRSL